MNMLPALCSCCDRPQASIEMTISGIASCGCISFGSYSENRTITGIDGTYLLTRQTGTTYQMILYGWSNSTWARYTGTTCSGSPTANVVSTQLTLEATWGEYGGTEGWVDIRGIVYYDDFNASRIIKPSGTLPYSSGVVLPLRSCGGLRPFGGGTVEIN